MSNKTIGKISLVLSKLIEAAFWIGAVTMVVCLVLALFNQHLMVISPVSDQQTVEFDVMGMDFGQINVEMLLQAFLIAAPFVFGIFTCMALIFRSIHQILKSLKAGSGQAFSEDNSPFQPVIVKQIKKIGWLAIAIPILEMVGSWIASFFFTGMEPSVNLLQFALGLCVLFLASIFAYGSKLQEETNGLV